MLLAGWFGGTEIIIILVLALLIFGGAKLPQLGEGLGKMLRGFRRELKAMEADKKAEEDDKKAEIDVTPTAVKNDTKA
ncbi:MAG: twin-arginine translocase TatA/TatE family subunit [Myxococcales bacterium]|nr:twin-arginine translocase TatA/TatE family subunit [Myxococcales bacterium]